MQALRAFSFFSGAGGMDLGFQQAGFVIDLHNENSKACINTLTENHFSGNILRFNIEDISFSSINQDMLKCTYRLSGTTGFYHFPIPDVVFGGPPCQSFSVAGQQNPEDVRSSLVAQYLRVIREIRPKAFVLENVPTLLMSHKPYIKCVREQILCMQDVGYTVTAYLLNAKHYGTPQSRERAFFFGVQNDIITESLINNFQSESPTSGEVLLAIGKNGRGEIPNVKITFVKKPILRPSPYAGMLFNGRGRPINLGSSSWTIPASGGNGIPIVDDEAIYDGKEPWVLGYHKHLMSGGEPYLEAPKRLRRLTLVEAAALQGFPSDFKFCGTASDKYRQIGNAVPPPMAKALAKTVMQVLMKGK